jgi:hypothetical protein
MPWVSFWVYSYFVFYCLHSFLLFTHPSLLITDGSHLAFWDTWIEQAVDYLCPCFLHVALSWRDGGTVKGPIRHTYLVLLVNRLVHVVPFLIWQNAMVRILPSPGSRYDIKFLFPRETTYMVRYLQKPTRCTKRGGDLCYKEVHV